MGTLQSMVSTLPHPLQVRYRGSDGSGTQWVSWLNDGLEELERERLLPEITFERGVEVSNDVWITPPPTYRSGIELFNPQQPSIKYPFRESEGKIRLTAEFTFDKEADPDTVSAFTNQATDSIELNVTGHGEDDLKDFLLVITAGTLAGTTKVIGSNDDSALGVTKIYFLHELGTAWTAAQATAGYLVDKSNYLILRHIGFFEPITVITDEIPVSRAHEGVMKSYLMWKAWERVRNVTDQTQYWAKEYNEDMAKLRAERFSIGRSRRIRGRRLYGLEQPIEYRYATIHTSES